MRKVRINLAVPSLRRTLHETPMTVRALAVAAGLMLLAAAIGAYRYAGQMAGYEQQLAALRARDQALVPLPPSPRTPQVSPAQAAAINAAVIQLNLPWRGLRDAVAGATPPAIALLALEPDAKNRVLRITAEAKNSDDMVGYVEQIQSQEWFEAAALTRHEINEQDPNRPLRFQLDARWRQP
ncbi:hypothetical protein GCM10027321_44530 [Massilia terrae]|uniref:PilN domain-containing protein n=1 Tax=Massilia terrae TaxID=1811224 RepID=A0ABT2CYG3_9BURK|nr:PilN domain-containing protein [Massilia terrae]MCS0659019.1 PilN domain-containing protein [Massilia terrae]